MAVLDSEGKVPSASAKLMRVVIGWTRVSRHDLSREVGIISREQVALEEFKMALRTSSTVAGEKLVSRGGGKGGGICIEEASQAGNEEESLDTLSPKNLRKEETSSDGPAKDGSVGRDFRFKRESSADHNFFGWLEHAEIKER